MHKLTSRISHFQGLFVRKPRQVFSLSVYIWIFREVAAHVLDQLALFGLKLLREEHRTEVRSAAPERGDDSALSCSEESRHDNNGMPLKSSLYLLRDHLDNR